MTAMSADWADGYPNRTRVRFYLVLIVESEWCNCFAHIHGKQEIQGSSTSPDNKF